MADKVVSKDGGITTFEGEFEMTKVYDTVVNQKFPFSFRAFDSIELAKQNGWNDDDVLKVINGLEKSNARAKEYARKIDELKLKPEKDDPKVVYKNLLAQYALIKMTPDVAKSMAETVMAQAGFSPEQYLS